jgi:flagellar biosynthetic protein FliR
MTAYFASLASALVQDPVVDQQTATLAGFFTTLGMTVIFATDLHHLMLQGIVDGYAVFPAGRPPPVDDFAAAIGRLVAESFVLGVQLAAPFLIVGVGFQVALGLLGRLMPQLPVYFFGMPLQVGLQVWVLVLTLSGLTLVFLDRFAGALGMLAPPG